MRSYKRTARVDFDAINRAATSAMLWLLTRWLPDGRREGQEWISRNPTRVDRHPGSFKVNIHTGRWSDFATGDKGGDPISLFAYLNGIGQLEAARQLQEEIGA